MSIFLNDDLEIRPGWRFALYVLIFVTLLFANGAFISMFVDGPAVLASEVGLLWLNALALAVPAFLTFLFMLHFVDRIPALAFGTGLHEGWGRDFLLGVAVAGGMILLYIAAGALVGDFTIGYAAGEGFWARFGLIVAALAVAAANEELVFRGYPLQALMSGIGTWPAILVLSGLFGLIHHLNPNATWLGTLNTVIAGVLLSVGYLRTRSLWFPYGLHIGWNLALGPVFGFPVSGLELSSIFTSDVAGSASVVGGPYGPEGGLLGTGVMLAATIAVARWKRLEVSPSVGELVSRHSGKVPALG